MDTSSPPAAAARHAFIGAAAGRLATGIGVRDLDPKSSDAGNQPMQDDDVAAGADSGVYRSEPYLHTNEIPMIDVEELKAKAGIPSSPPAASHAADGSDLDDGPDPDDGGPRPSFRKRHPKLTIAAIVVVIIMIPITISWVQAMTKESNESLLARNVQWARDMKLGFVVDRIEQKYYERDQYADGGTPEAGVFTPAAGAPATTGGGGTTGSGNKATTTKAMIPHTEPPTRMASPVDPPQPGEGEWTPVGPLTDGLPGAYITKVRPNTTKTSLAVFVSWADPKLTTIKLFPGSDLPGGKWDTPNYLTPDICPKAIVATNSGFRMDQARGGYYAEGRAAFPLRDGAASLVFFKDGHVDVAQWGRDYTNADLDKIESVRQNLELMVDNGQPVPGIDKDKDWGALLPNSYFVWRSGYGVTKDGALVFAGGPALKPTDLAQTLINAGAVRVMEGDINPEWVSGNTYTVVDGKCTGAKGLPQSEDQGGMRQPADRYLSKDTRDFVAVLAKQ
jgi:hypothetical protein